VLFFATLQTKKKWLAVAKRFFFFFWPLRGRSAAQRPIACYRWFRDGGSAYLVRRFSEKMARRGQTLLNGGFAMASVPARGPQARPPGPFQGPISKALRPYLQRNRSYLQRRDPHWFFLQPKCSYLQRRDPHWFFLQRNWFICNAAFRSVP